MKKVLILILVSYILVLLQTSFLVHFSILGIVPNFIFILVIFWNFFEKSKNPLGLFYAVSGGFFLDVFSSRPFGFYILILGIISLFIKLVIKKYVRIPFAERS